METGPHASKIGAGFELAGSACIFSGREYSMRLCHAHLAILAMPIATSTLDKPQWLSH
jgi:hypothetical protein